MAGFDFCLCLNRWKEEVVLEQAVGGTFRPGLLREAYLWKGGLYRK